MRTIIKQSTEKTVDGTDYMVLTVTADLARKDVEVWPPDLLLRSETVRLSRQIPPIPILIDLSNVKDVDLNGAHAILTCHRILRDGRETVSLMPSKPVMAFLRLMFIDPHKVVRSRKRFECLIRKTDTYEEK